MIMLMYQMVKIKKDEEEDKKNVTMVKNRQEGKTNVNKRKYEHKRNCPAFRRKKVR